MQEKAWLKSALRGIEILICEYDEHSREVVKISP